MEWSVLQTLEYDRVLEAVESLASSFPGREAVRAMRPMSHFSEIRRAQDECSDAVRLELSLGAPPLFGITTIRPSLKRAALGGVLSMKELLSISEMLRVSEALIAYAGEAEDGMIVREIRGLFVQPGLQREIADAILSEDEMADGASRALYSIRQSMRAKQDQIKTRLNDLLAHAGWALCASGESGISQCRQGRRS